MNKWSSPELFLQSRQLTWNSVTVICH